MNWGQGRRDGTGVTYGGMGQPMTLGAVQQEPPQCYKCSDAGHIACNCPTPDAEVMRRFGRTVWKPPRTFTPAAPVRQNCALGTADTWAQTLAHEDVEVAMRALQRQHEASRRTSQGMQPSQGAQLPQAP